MNPDRSSGRRPTVAVVGDAGLDPDSAEARFAHDTGRALVDAGYVVVCGGRGGVMEAACRGARESPEWRHGSIVGILPGHDPAGSNAFVDIVIPTGLDVARNAIVAHADAVVAAGGGAGTLSEMALAWQIRRMVVAFRGRGWAGRLADQRIDERVRHANIPDDRVYGVDSADEVVALLSERLPLHTFDNKGIGDG